MTKTKVTIHIKNSSSLLEDHVVILGEAYIKRWKIPTNKKVTLRFGSAKKEIQVISSTSSTALRMTESLADHFGLHHGLKLGLLYKSGSRTLRIGPVIGVMICRVHTQKPDRLFGTITSFCKELTDACEKSGVFVYFFTPDDISHQVQSVKGWSYSDKWNKKTFPAPDILYNRLTSRIMENKSSVQHFMKEVKSQFGTHIFNEQYLNKTEVFAALKNETSLHAYLPESYPFKNYQMLKTMCARHKTIFLKPISGSLGKGILRISRQTDVGYQCQFTQVGGARTLVYPSLPHLFSSISGKIKQQRFQIQQGLKLIEVGGRPVDFRALVQRNATGEWSITSTVARIAGNNHFVSNLARGGTLSPVNEAVAKSNLNPMQRKVVVHKLRKASLEIAKGIETQIPAHFAELGVDLAIDEQGRIWLLEVNSKPSKEDNTSIGEQKIRPSVSKVVQYSIYLAKF